MWLSSLGRAEWLLELTSSNQVVTHWPGSTPSVTGTATPVTLTSRKAVQRLQDAWIIISFDIELDVWNVYVITLVLC